MYCASDCANGTGITLNPNQASGARFRPKLAREALPVAQKKSWNPNQASGASLGQNLHQMPAAHEEV